LWSNVDYFHSPQPKAVSETEEQDLAQLMAKAGQENAEVSGDEDEDDIL
jgi:translation initiation factor 2 subunit 1